VPKALRDLTQHELGALVMISCALANDQIAKALVVSEATVKTHVNRIWAEIDAVRPSARGCPRVRVGLARPGELRLRDYAAY
jgi:DNA-binding NarL/FixJ family response regulator